MKKLIVVFHRRYALLMGPPIDAILSVHRGQLSEVAELRWDGASQLIRSEVPERRRKIYK